MTTKLQSVDPKRIDIGKVLGSRHGSLREGEIIKFYDCTGLGVGGCDWEDKLERARESRIEEENVRRDSKN